MMITERQAGRIVGAVEKIDRLFRDPREAVRFYGEKTITVIITGFTADNMSFLCKLASDAGQAEGDEFTVYADVTPPGTPLRAGTPPRVQVFPAKNIGHALKVYSGWGWNGTGYVTGFHTRTEFTKRGC